MPYDIEEKRLFMCNCGGEGITVEGMADGDWSEIWIAFWGHGHGQRPNLAWRLRLIWRVIKTGYPDSDMVTLSFGNAQRMAAEINRFIEENTEAEG